MGDERRIWGSQVAFVAALEEVAHDVDQPVVVSVGLVGGALHEEAPVGTALRGVGLRGVRIRYTTKYKMDFRKKTG
jgi:hypothetical protein